MKDDQPTLQLLPPRGAWVRALTVRSMCVDCRPDTHMQLGSRLTLQLTPSRRPQVGLPAGSVRRFMPARHLRLGYRSVLLLLSPPDSACSAREVGGVLSEFINRVSYLLRAHAAR